MTPADASADMRPGWHTGVSWLTLLTSASTLVCCALPALLVAAGAGAALSVLVSTVPQIVWLSEHKIALFAIGGVMLALAGAAQWRARTLTCPPDPALADACTTTRDQSKWVFRASLAIYAVGFFFAFIAPALI